MQLRLRSVIFTNHITVQFSATCRPVVKTVRTKASFFAIASAECHFYKSHFKICHGKKKKKTRTYVSGLRMQTASLHRRCNLYDDQDPFNINPLSTFPFFLSSHRSLCTLIRFNYRNPYEQGEPPPQRNTNLFLHTKLTRRTHRPRSPHVSEGNCGCGSSVAPL